METLSETEFAPPVSSKSFIPNVFVDVSEFMTKKIEILSTYETEISEAPFPRSIEIVEALAKLRGSLINCKYAESFKRV